MSPRNPRGNLLLGDCLCFRSGSKEVIVFTIANRKGTTRRQKPDSGIESCDFICASAVQKRNIIGLQARRADTRAAQKPLRIRAESAQNPRTRGPFGSFANPFSSFVGPFGSLLVPLAHLFVPLAHLLVPLAHLFCPAVLREHHLTISRGPLAHLSDQVRD